MYQKQQNDPHLMTNLPADFKQYLTNRFDLTLPEIDIQKQATDGTTKHRLKLSDGALIEMVLIPDPPKMTLCISSQVGCARACSFCATGGLGLSRNLEVHEIVGQIILAAKLTAPTRITNLVFMGMGEPMDNLSNVLASLKIIQDENTISFSPRRTTVSSCGIPDGIVRLADSMVKTKLAISLNSAIDEKRNQLMPVNKLFPLLRLKQALLYYLRKSSFRITFEYILIPGFNMDSQDLKALRKFVGDLPCKVNFIPYNPVPGLPYRSPNRDEIERFLHAAQSLNQAITLRKSRGAEICGACGQLAIL